jgi:hypothetical protein
MTTTKTTTRKPKAEKTEAPTFELNKVYQMIALKGAKHLVEGKVYELTGEIAKELYKKGYAKLK